MIAALIYLAVLFLLIRRQAFFGVFKDPVISPQQFGWLFLFKAMAIPVFYVVYQNVYGGIAGLDTGKYFHDAVILSQVAKTDLALYLKTLFGFQNDDRNSYDYYMLYQTQNWDNGTMKDFLYNDNRIVIRVHSLLNFIAFNAYFVHALFSCLLSFIGIFFIYKSFSRYFAGKEIYFLVLFCFFPALWFHTGALLKEGLSLFVLGSCTLLLKQLFFGEIRAWKIPLLLFLLFVSLLLKAYLLFYGAMCFGLLFALQRWVATSYRVLAFLFCVFASVLLGDGISRLVKHQSLKQAVLSRERIFSGMAKGGIYLYGPDRFIRLNYDSNLVKRSSNKAMGYSIRKNAPYMYWMDAASVDTLYCTANSDTSTVYTLAYMIKPSGSNLQNAHPGEPLHYLGRALLNSLTYPLFEKQKDAKQWLTMAENLVVLLALLIACLGLLLHKKDPLPVLVFLIFGLGICILVGATSPNGGAIFRYRSPALPFLCLSALYYLPWNFRDVKNAAQS